MGLLYSNQPNTHKRSIYFPNAGDGNDLIYAAYATIVREIINNSSLALLKKKTLIMNVFHLQKKIKLLCLFITSFILDRGKMQLQLQGI